jgi:hypothetical protein
MFIFRLPKIPPTNQPPRKGGVPFIPCVAVDFVSDRNYRRTFLLLSRKKDFFRNAGLLEEDRGQQIARLARLEPALLHLFAATSDIRSDKTFTEPWTHRELLQSTRVTGAGLYKNIALGFRFM